MDVRAPTRMHISANTLLTMRPWVGPPPSSHLPDGCSRVLCVTCLQGVSRSVSTVFLRPAHHEFQQLAVSHAPS